MYIQPAYRLGITFFIRSRLKLKEPITVQTQSDQIAIDANSTLYLDQQALDSAASHCSALHQAIVRTKTQHYPGGHITDHLLDRYYLYISVGVQLCTMQRQPVVVQGYEACMSWALVYGGSRTTLSASDNLNFP